MVQLDNYQRQAQVDASGIARPRSLNVRAHPFSIGLTNVLMILVQQFSIPAFTDPEYELVALHPEHFLPDKTILTIYNRATAGYTNYVAANDRHIRQSANTNSPRLPPFRHITMDRTAPNIFLVILNAEIKFKRYFEMLGPVNPLPADVLTLMRRTIHLVDLLYWQPVPAEGSPGAAKVAKTQAKRGNGRSGRPQSGQMFKGGSTNDREMYERNGKSIPMTSGATAFQTMKLRWKSFWGR